VMAWVAVDRAIKSIEKFGVAGPLDEWRTLRAKIHADVCANAWNSKHQMFTQAYGGSNLDASLLLMPQVGFLPATDPRVRSTIEAIQRELTDGGLVLRYRTEHTADGLPPGEGTFLACSFWMADALALLGRREEAHELFERLLALRNDVGLLSEEYDVPRKRQVGNFPQAFSHVALVNTGLNLMRHQQEIAHASGQPTDAAAA
jgi:GH15 family glucan-1,4-alpha-glucosidase